MNDAQKLREWLDESQKIRDAGWPTDYTNTLLPMCRKLVDACEHVLVSTKALQPNSGHMYLSVINDLYDEAKEAISECMEILK